MPLWSDVMKYFTYSFRPTPLEQAKGAKAAQSVGVTQPDAIPDLRGGNDGFWSGGKGTMRVSNDFVDLSSVSNRQARYKEYERLRAVAEIETAMTVFADEMCVAGDTKVATPFGYITIQELAEKKPFGERFLVYCYDFSKRDYGLGWAHSPRVVKTAPTVKIALDDGSNFVATPDHRILLRTGEWRMAGELRPDDELMPFYRQPADQRLTGLKSNQFARVFSFNDGWQHERQFIDEWKLNRKLPKYERVNKVIRMIQEGLSANQICQLMEVTWKPVKQWLKNEGFSYDEVKALSQKSDRRIVVGVFPGETIPVYDLSVDKHENFCGENVVFHNCQVGENSRLFEVKCDDDDVKDEAEFLLNEVLETEEWAWSEAKNLCLYGDRFWEIVISEENPKAGIVKVVSLPPDSVYRIETTKGKLLEFQQSKEGPDYQSLARVEVTKATDADLAQATAIRFAPEQIVHVKIGDDRKTFYPYGVSLVEAARGPAHQLRLMEDAMVVYRLCLVGDTRIRTVEGWKYITDIKIGDTVYCLDEQQRVTAVPVTWFVNNGRHKTLKVRTQHAEITGTVTHPLLVNRGGVIQWVDMQDIQPKIDKLVNVPHGSGSLVPIPKLDNSVVMLRREHCFENINQETLEAVVDDLCSANNTDRQKTATTVALFLTCRNRYGLRMRHAEVVCRHFGVPKEHLLVTKRKHKQVTCPDFVDEEFARFFGFMIGDGCVRKTGVSMSFAASPDAALNDRYRRTMQKYFGDVQFDRDKRSRHQECGNYVVNSVAAVDLMFAMGYRCTTAEKRIPTWVYDAPINIRRAFIEGISDADGCERFTNAGTWFSTISMSNKSLIEDIKEVWHGVGLCSGMIRTRVRKAAYRHSFNRQIGETTSHHVTITDRPLPKYDAVWSVTEAGEQEVYDFTVDHVNHNFVANGICSANTRAPERRVFYIDVGQLPPFKAEAFIERMKDQFRKKKVHTQANGGKGASGVEERWHAPAADEDYWLPIRPNSGTKIETLPGAQNLGEIDDALYFRNKLFIALNFPKNYAAQEADSQQTRITLSSTDVKFARLIERLQKSIAKGLREIVVRHLRLRGFPEDKWNNLQIKMTPPSDWREISRNEVVEARYNRAAAMKGAQLMSDYDILVDILRFDADKAKEYVTRMKQQKLEDLKLQVMGQNPQLLGLGQPPTDEKEIGADAKGPSSNPGPPPDPAAGGGDQPPPPPPGGDAGAPPPGGDAGGGPPAGGGNSGPGGPEGGPLPEPTDEDISKYNLGIRDYTKEIDEEEVDSTELGE